ncbi:MAG: cob(I)yrinic acid a,c-diamide adenosyltransferase [Longimicrobiales bacterium]|nr:cob(I)yrinic acid a,c-diamide adenosyltransferase [Longimicrobiales bacterium]
MSRIYTRTGDSGETGLFGGGRVPKSDPRVAAYGTVDELNAAIGWVLAHLDDEQLDPRLTTIQGDLFALGAHLATPADARSREHLPPLPDERVPELESWIDEADDELEPLSSFILPGGSPAGAALHLARTVCRRAERAVVDVADAETDPTITVYLNRLSDLLFVWARLTNHRADQPETIWRP